MEYYRSCPIVCCSPLSRTPLPNINLAFPHITQVREAFKSQYLLSQLPSSPVMRERRLSMDPNNANGRLSAAVDVPAAKISIDSLSTLFSIMLTGMCLC